MKETSEAVRPIILKYLEPFRDEHVDLHNIVSYFASKRLNAGSLLLKPLLVRLSYEVIGGIDWDKISPVCAAAELINISSYQSNLSFDGKLDISSRQKSNNQIIASFLSRELSFEIVNSIVCIIGERKVQKVLRCLEESNKQIYIGQFIDLNVLTRDTYDISNNFDDYLSEYIRRCEKLSGIFSEQCSIIGGILAGAKKNDLISLASFGRNFGIGLHIVNDIGDFVVPHRNNGKQFASCSYDCFSDIINGKITLPIFYTLCYGKDHQRDNLLKIIYKSQLDLNDKYYLLTTLLSCGAISYAKHLAKSYFVKAKRYIHLLPPSISRNYLSMMVSSLRTNKYFTAFRNINRDNIDYVLEKDTDTYISELV